jgi:hypothetical protein
MRRLTVALIVMGLLSIPASAYGLGWASETLTPPVGADETRLQAVSCTSSSFCSSPGWYVVENFEAVQSYGTWYNWNGSSWSSAGGLPEADLSIRGAACTSSSFCVAVGDYEKGEWTYAAHWNGTKWALVNTPNPYLAGNELNGVSCTSSTVCTAVGSGEWGVDTIALRWNGTTWSTQTTPNPGTANVLNGVSCTSTTHCVAVGSKVSGGTETTLAMTWNGTTWSTQATPNPTGSISASAAAVSCTSSSACFAVGVYHTSSGPLPFAMHWDGTSWSLKSVKLPAETNFGWLKGVSCTASTFCMAVGAYERIGQGKFTMAQKWNGTSWTAEKPANPGKSFNELHAISCTASNWCKAAGFYINGESVISPFIDHFSG